MSSYDSISEFHAEAAAAETYRLFVNDERTVMVHLWPSGTVDVATRDNPAHTWGPPVLLKEEKVR